MNRSVKRETSIEGSGLQQSPKKDDVNLESRYECPICIYWLNEPVLTKCGHRFCRKCITDWLNKNNSNCPIDNEPLQKEGDIFPDNFTRREILQIKKNCPNNVFGCPEQFSPTEVDDHLKECEFSVQNRTLNCPFRRVKCQFTTELEPLLADHLKSDYQVHLQLLLDSYAQREEQFRLWDAPDKNSQTGDNSNYDLIRAMHERIVILEQELRIQSIKLSKLETVTTKATTEVDPRYSSGVLLWRLDDFRGKMDAMIGNSNCMFYSSEAYTSPYGYKFCARINIPPKTKDCIGLHVHLMQSENDYHLDWPFKGRIKFTLVNRSYPEHSQHDTMMSNPDVLAFHRPQCARSPRGFGFLEYVSIKDILTKYMDDNTVTIKIQMNIV